MGLGVRVWDLSGKRIYFCIDKSVHQVHATVNRSDHQSMVDQRRQRSKGSPELTLTAATMDGNSPVAASEGKAREAPGGPHCG
jgi:hypothetical protein